MSFQKHKITKEHFHTIDGITSFWFVHESCYTPNSTLLHKKRIKICKLIFDWKQRIKVKAQLKNSREGYQYIFKTKNFQADLVI